MDRAVWMGIDWLLGGNPLTLGSGQPVSLGTYCIGLGAQPFQLRSLGADLLGFLVGQQACIQRGA